MSPHLARLHRSSKSDEGWSHYSGRNRQCGSAKSENHRWRETYHRPTEMQDFCEKENLAIAVERALPGLCAGELYTASDQTSGTVVGELRVVLEERREVVVGMMD